MFDLLTKSENEREGRAEREKKREKKRSSKIIGIKRKSKMSKTRE